MSETTTHPKARIPRRKRRGYSIVEIGLVLIIVAVLISAIIVAFYQVQQSTRQGQATNLVNEIYAAVQDLHRSATSFGTGDLIDTVMEPAEVVPPIGRRPGSPVTIVSPFGEPVTVVGNNQTFIVTLENYTRANCIAFMSNYVDRTLEQSGLVSVSSNGQPFAFPLTVAAVGAGCREGDLALEFR